MACIFITGLTDALSAAGHALMAEGLSTCKITLCTFQLAERNGERLLWVGRGRTVSLHSVST
jgi:hypothetical protein